MIWLGVDQAVANTGWVVIEDDVVQASGVLGEEATGFGGTMDMIVRAQSLRFQFVELLRWTEPSWVVMEHPAVRGWRTDSSMLAASALVTAMVDVGYEKALVINAQKVRKTLGAANKGAVKSRVSELLQHDRGADGKRLLWNNHITDAAGLVVCAQQGEATEVLLSAKLLREALV